MSTLAHDQAGHTRRHLIARGSALLLARHLALGAAAPANQAEFERTEQALMNALAPGDKQVWAGVMDEGCVLTSEEGQVMTREQFLKEMAPLPAGLSGHITVRDLTVQEFPAFAVVRYLADEWEIVFEQRLTTQYRATDTFRKTGDGWKMVASHFSVITRDPAPQIVAAGGWPQLAGSYQLLPNGWTFQVSLRNGQLYGGRDPKQPRLLLPLTSDCFVLQGSLGIWAFACAQNGKPAGLVEYRKFEPLVWTRVS